MTIIKKMVDAIEEELEGAENYAEKYVECKAKGHSQKASHYKEMAEDELKHSSWLHEWAVQEIDELSKIYIPPPDMMEKWEKAHKEYVAKAALIRQMLAL